MGSVWRDLKYAFRTLVRTPGFTTVAILSLALGIGANTAIFTLTNAVFLNPLPVRDAARVIEVYTVDHATTTTAANLQRTAMSFLNYKDFRDQNRIRRPDGATTTTCSSPCAATILNAAPGDRSSVWNSDGVKSPGYWLQVTRTSVCRSTMPGMVVMQNASTTENTATHIARPIDSEAVTASVCPACRRSRRRRAMSSVIMAVGARHPFRGLPISQ